MKVLVCGGRSFDNATGLYWVLNVLSTYRSITEIIEGGAPGADALSRKFGEMWKIPVKTFPADWQAWGKRAGPVRNIRMLREGKPDLVIAFPGGSGTNHMVSIAEIDKVPVLDLRGHECLTRMDVADIVTAVQAVLREVEA